MKKILRNIVLALALLAVLVLPVAALAAISQLEKAQYTTAPDIQLEELAYGDICSVFRTDMEQTVTVTSASVVSTAVKFIELNGYAEPYNIRFLISHGDHIHAGDVIGYYQGEPIEATLSGVVRAISTGSDSYIMLESLDDLVLTGYVDETAFNWKQEGLKLTLGEEAFDVVSVEQAAEENQAKITLASPTAELVYGRQYAELTLKTGRVFSGTLVVDARCVYSHAGDERKFIRTVTDYGAVLSEVEVKTGYSDGKYICVSAAEGGYIDEYTLCDAGYKSVLDGLNG